MTARPDEIIIPLDTELFQMAHRIRQEICGNRLAGILNAALVSICVAREGRGVEDPVFRQSELWRSSTVGEKRGPR
jgi:hypothetical protein